MEGIADRLRSLALRTVCCCLVLLTAPPSLHAQSPGSEQLGKALDYMMSEKYHEALIIFQQLDREYELNERFKAYIGLCYYHEWDYEQAVKYFDRALPHLGGLAPHERSVYYYAAAESYFQLRKYASALPYYRQALAVCYDNERGDIYFRIGFCHLFAEEWPEALSAYRKAQTAYTRFRRPDDVAARQAQTARIIEGIDARLRKQALADSLHAAKVREDSLRRISAAIPLDSLLLTPVTPSDSLPVPFGGGNPSADGSEPPLNLWQQIVPPVPETWFLRPDEQEEQISEGEKERMDR